MASLLSEEGRWDEAADPQLDVVAYTAPPRERAHRRTRPRAVAKRSPSSRWPAAWPASSMRCCATGRRILPRAVPRHAAEAVAPRLRGGARRTRKWPISGIPGSAARSRDTILGPLGDRGSPGSERLQNPERSGTVTAVREMHKSRIFYSQVPTADPEVRRECRLGSRCPSRRCIDGAPTLRLPSCAGEPRSPLTSANRRMTQPRGSPGSIAVDR